MIRTTSGGQNDTKEDDADNNRDFERTEPKLDLSEDAYAEVVDSDDPNPKDDDEHAWINLVSRNPVLKNKSQGCQLICCAQ